MSVKIKSKARKIKKSILPEKYKRLYSMGAAKMAFVDNMFVQKMSTIQIARVIQQDWKLFTDVAEATLVQQINRYRLDCIKEDGELEELKKRPIKIEKEQQPDGGVKFQVEVRVDPAQYSTLQKLTELAVIQEQRIKIAFAKESEVGLLFSNTSKDVETYITLMERLQKMRFDLGVDDFRGPIVQGGKIVATQVNLPDGTQVKTAISEVAGVAVPLLQQCYERRKKLLEGVNAARSDSEV